MELKNKRVFISGGNGVIGNELVSKLHNMGAKIFVGDLKPRPLHWPVEIEYRQGNLNFITQNELGSFNPEVFFHLAATFERSTETYEFWNENFHHNVSLSNYLMTLLKDSSSLKRVIFASSYLIYDPDLYQFSAPQAKPVSLNETHPISPRNLTGMAKLAHEIELKFLSGFDKSYSVCSARIFRGYGRNSRDIISRWIRALINNEEIFLYRKEGIFDYIFAEDTAEGLIRLAKSDYSGIVNLGTGKARKVEEVVSELKKHFPDAKISEADSDIPYEASQADTKKYFSITKWLPEDQVEDGIKKIVDFEKRRMGKYEEISSTFGNILITSISKKVPLINCVRNSAAKLSSKIKIYGGDIDNDCLGKHFVDKFWEMPKLCNLTIKEILLFCNENKIETIIPTRDGELEFWSVHQKELSEHGINVMISGPQTVINCIDKYLFYQTSVFLGIPAIKTEKRIENISADYFVVKEQYGAGSLSLGLKLNKDEAILHAEKLQQPIFQPYIHGEEISVDVYVTKKGKCKGVVLRKRDKIVNGESQVSTTFIDSKLEQQFEKYSEMLKINGHAVFQAIIDKDSNLYVIECNCRFGGASTLSIYVGLDSFYWLLLESRSADISNYSSLLSKKPLKQVRIPKDEYFLNDIT